jgi:hypothetical protein
MSDTLREVASTIFFALHAVYDDAEVAESTKVLREAVKRNYVRDPEAREILLEIADHALPPPKQPRYVVESGDIVRLLR